MKTAQQAAHTQGPWTVRKDHRAAHPPTVMASATAIAKCNEYVREVEANARLIAAAPDLLAALIDTKNRLSALALDAHVPENAIRAIASNGAQEIRAAIAKATQP